MKYKFQHFCGLGGGARGSRFLTLIATSSIEVFSLVFLLIIGIFINRFVIVLEGRCLFSSFCIARDFL